MPILTNTQQNKFIKQLSTAEKESDVRIVYRNLFEPFYGNIVKMITKYHNTDILLEHVGDLFRNLKLLVEIKYELDFTVLKKQKEQK